MTEEESYGRLAPDAPPHLSFPQLAGPHIRHGFFTRRGGVSRGIYGTLNCGLGSDDDRAAIIENRTRVTTGFGTEAVLASVHQVHGDDVHIIRAPAQAAERPQADGLVTDCPDIILSVLTADCAPVLFADPVAGVIGAAHAGWRGALAGICEAVIEAMQSLGARPENIAAVIGPAISGRNYEVDATMEAEFTGRQKAWREFFAPGRRGEKRQFHLVPYVARRLEVAGIGAIGRKEFCTYADPERFFSFRRATHLGDPDYGRALSAIMLSKTGI